ncbi:MAG: MATE family efflux transporter [Tissierellia bacterium]|nr:MATE family efflux transporter [Tissierellia bacterium]
MKENKMGTESIPKLLLTMSLPIALSMLVQSMYNVVDSVFVSRIGEDALAAVTMAFPITFLMNAITVGTGVGMNAVLSRFLGEKRHEDANLAGQTGLFMNLCYFIVFFLVGVFLVPKFFQLQTDNPIIRQYGTTYLRISTIFSIGFLMQVTNERLLQSTGRAVLSMISQMVGAIFNIIADPILIFGLGPFPELGVAGAAVATVSGQIVAALLGFYLNLNYNKEINLLQKGFRPRAQMIKKISEIGVPSMIMISVNSLSLFVMNNILLPFSSTAVVAFGINFRVQSFAMMPMFGINSGIIPLVAYNYGAKKPDRIHEVIRDGYIAGAVLMITGCILLQLFPRPILGLFNASEELMAIGVVTVRRVNLGLLLSWYTIISAGVFQALGQSFTSMMINLIRQLIVLLPMAYFLSLTGKLNLIWFAYPIAEIAASTLARLNMKRLLRERVDTLAF